MRTSFDNTRCFIKLTVFSFSKCLNRVIRTQLLSRISPKRMRCRVQVRFWVKFRRFFLTYLLAPCRQATLSSRITSQPEGAGNFPKASRLIEADSDSGNPAEARRAGGYSAVLRSQARMARQVTRSLGYQLPQTERTNFRSSHTLFGRALAAAGFTVRLKSLHKKIMNSNRWFCPSIRARNSVVEFYLLHLIVILISFSFCSFANEQEDAVGVLLNKRLKQKDIEKLFSPLSLSTSYWKTHWGDVDKYNYRRFIDGMSSFISDFIFLNRHETKTDNLFAEKHPYVEFIYSCYGGELERLHHYFLYADSKEKKKYLRRIFHVVGSIINSYPISFEDDYAEGILFIESIRYAYIIDPKVINDILEIRLRKGDISDINKLPIWVILSQSNDKHKAKQYRLLLSRSDKDSFAVRRMMDLFKVCRRRN